MDDSKYGQLKVSWNKVGTQTTYTLDRAVGKNVPNITQNEYIDKDLACAGNYIYKITGSLQKYQWQYHQNIIVRSEGEG
ncbi:MAG: hypothetical protein U5M51_05085 [Emticicia sp.]|nr:hypothetical protein [Emticicia sp.]